MIESEVNTDVISERYRKYAVELCYRKLCVYPLYGADLATQNQDDKLLLDTNGQILTFEDIHQLKQFILSSKSLLFDRGNTILWAKNFAGKQAYSTYNLDYVLSIVEKKISLKKLDKLQTVEIINFINLFGDYAYQTRDSTFLTLHQEKNVRTFLGYTYDSYVWDNPKHATYKSLNELDYLRFDPEEFISAIRQMVRMFVDRITVL